MPRELKNAIVNCALAIIFTLFALAHVQQFAAQPRLSLVLIVGMETILVFFFLARKDADQTSYSWQAWLATSAGTMFPLLLRPVPEAQDLVIGQVLQTFGVMFQIVAVLSLNRSMGLLPAHREIKTHGAYRIVRHPLYAGYTIVLLGYLLSNWSTYNIAIIATGMAFQVMRIMHEESLLFTYPDYKTFAGETRWRLVPYIW